MKGIITFNGKVGSPLFPSTVHHKLIQEARKEAKGGVYDQATSKLMSVLDSIATPSEAYALLLRNKNQKNHFLIVLATLFQESWDQFETLIPLLQRHYKVVLYERNYVSIVMDCDEPSPLRSSFELRRDVRQYTFEEGAAILRSLPYETQNDLVLVYLGLRKLHEARVEESITLALEHIESQDAYLSSVGCDALVDYCIVKAQNTPEKSEEWVAKAMQQLENLASQTYTYHYVAVSIGKFLQEKGETAQWLDVIDLIVANIQRTKDNMTRSLLCLSFITSFPDFTGPISSSRKTSAM